MLAIGLSTFAINSNAQNVAVNYQDLFGPGVNATVSVTKNEPILAPIHLAAGGYSKYQKVVGWSARQENVPVHIPGNKLEEQGYYWASPIVEPPHWWNFDPAIPWGWMFFWLALLAGVILLVWLIMYVIRMARQPQPAPTVPGNVVNNHYYQPQVPAQMGPNVPSYDAGEINSVIETLKSGLRSGSVYYAHGNGERLHIKVHGPWNGSTDVAPSVQQPNPTSSPNNQGGENKG